MRGLNAAARSWLLAAVCLCVSFACNPRAAAQLPAGPHIGYVYPAGGRQSSTFQVKIGGQFLDGVTNAYISGKGVTAVVLEHTKPLNAGQANALRERLKELQNKRAGAMRNRRLGGTNVVWTAADARSIEEIRTKLAGFQRRPPNPAIAETVTLRVTVAPDAGTGRRELRLGATQGLSNPLVFCLGQLPEVCEKVSAPAAPLSSRKGTRNAGEGQAVPANETAITIPAVVNGQILQGGVDRYRFRARQGQKLVISVSARELIPYIADAVPGWFQATLTLRDSRGKELAYKDDYRFRPDPVLFYEVPKDGDYVVEIKDAIYRGREDFVYRISIAETPFLTGIFPLGGPERAATTLDLSGWNLPLTQLVEGPDTNTGIREVSISNGKLTSNLLPFALDSLPECFEQEPNDDLGTAQAVRLPIIVNGRIGKPHDTDIFKFDGRAGDQVVAEIVARRLESPLDSFLRIADATGRQLAFNDDHEDRGSGLNTHHADSYLRVSLPATGVYSVQVTDAQRKGGDAFTYRLRLSAPRPDFALRVVPSSVNIRAGAEAPITVYALRQDGFTNEITLELEDAPRGFGLSGARIPAGADQVRLTLSGAPQPSPVSISLSGYAFIEGRRVSHEAVPADDMMQAFAYHHLVPAEELKVSVAGRLGGRGGMRLTGPLPVKIPTGGTASVRVNAPASALKDRFDLELSEPPEGLSIERIDASGFGSEIVLKADAKEAKPGLKGNLIVNIVANRASANKAKKQPIRRAAVGVLPAIPFEVVAHE